MRSAILTIGILAFSADPVIADWSPNPSSAERAASFVAALASGSPSLHGVPLRRYEIRDINHDGDFEVLEHQSELEERATGYLAVEWAPPTYWITVYSERSGGFEQSTGTFQSFLQERVAFYERWVSILEPSKQAQPQVLAEARKNLKRAQVLLHALQPKRLQLTPNSSLQLIRGTVLAAGAVPQR